MMFSRYCTPLVGLSLIFSSSLSIAADNADASLSGSETENIEEIMVWGRAIDQIGDADSASHGLVGYSDISARPLLRVGELIEVMPGMVATQHSGSGKANQYFLRGMNLDHGTDVSVLFEGVPVNFRTHAHGQGYLDLNFVIPELMETIEYRKGTYYADVGDFSAAGSAAFKTYDRLDQGFVELDVGEFGYQRFVAADSLDLQSGTLLLAGEVQRQEGPWELSEEVQKYNALVKYSTQINDIDAQLIATAYTNDWQATDQIPLREVEAGRLSRFGFVDPDLGGETQRFSLIGKASKGNFDATVYAIHYELNLFSNPTYFQEDPVNGDELEQADKRQVYGGSLVYSNNNTWAGIPVRPKYGVEFRYDDIEDTNLYNTVARERINALIDDEVEELSLSAYAEAEFLWTEKLRTTFGLRADYYDWDVQALVPGDELNSGSGNDSIVSPKFSLAYKLFDEVELYASYGYGFHSNDVRGVEVDVDPVEALVKIEGGEIGFSSEAIEGLNISMAAFWMDTDSELIFVGDAGTTEPTNGAERKGIELEAFWQPKEWLVFDITAAATDAKFKGLPAGEDHVPDAHEFVAGAGATLTLAQGLTSSLRVRHFGEAPLDEADSRQKESTTLVNLGMSYDLGKLELGLDVLNLFDTQANDIEFLFESQLAGEAAPVEDIHFHPVISRSVRASLRYQF